MPKMSGKITDIFQINKQKAIKMIARATILYFYLTIRFILYKSISVIIWAGGNFYSYSYHTYSN